MQNVAYSVNPFTGKRSMIPEVLDDKKRIDGFLEMNAGKKVVVVQGLGFVGSVMALVCANALTEEYAVIGVELASPGSYWKIQSINEGVFPVISSDPKIDLFFTKTKEKKNFIATFDPYCYSKADVIIVDINLDVDKKSNFEMDLEGYDVSLKNFKKAIETIGNHCRENVSIVVETTVPPGTCQKIVKPVLEECLTERGLTTGAYTLGHSYERVMPGPDYIDSIQNFYRVYSGMDDRSAIATETFLRTIISTEKYPLTRLGSTNATEMAKVLENSYRAMNIGFMVEWSRFAEEAGVNLYEVVDSIRMRPTHSNLMYPGIGVGGYCLTKDPLLASWARQNIFESNERLTQSETGVTINDKMPLYAFEFLKKEFNGTLQDKKILMLGVSYRSNVGDTRYSPVEYLYNYINKETADITMHDPYVSYWEEKQMNVEQDLNAFFPGKWDVVIISTGHVEYKKNQKLMNQLLELDSAFILDTIGLLTKEEIYLLSGKHKVRVVGRGDIK